MCLTEKFFKERDQFIAQQEELGNYSLTEVLQKLNVEHSYFNDLGILDTESNILSPYPSQLTPLGGLFFIQKYHQIVITPKNLELLEEALEHWDNFTIQYALPDSDLIGNISVIRQKDVRFRVDTAHNRYRLNFKMKNIDNDDRLNNLDTLNIFFSVSESEKLVNIWNNFSQCIDLIENDDKSPTNIEIATDPEAIDTLCTPWNPIVQQYFKNQMHRIGFEHNVQELKDEIEQVYSAQDAKWMPITEVFERVRPNRQDQANDENIKRITMRSIDQLGMIEPQHTELLPQRNNNRRIYTRIQPGDILLLKRRNKVVFKNLCHFYTIDKKEMTYDQRFRFRTSH